MQENIPEVINERQETVDYHNNVNRKPGTRIGNADQLIFATNRMCQSISTVTEKLATQLGKLASDKKATDYKKKLTFVQKNIARYSEKLNTLNKQLDDAENRIDKEKILRKITKHSKQMTAFDSPFSKFDKLKPHVIELLSENNKTPLQELLSPEPDKTLEDVAVSAPTTTARSEEALIDNNISATTAMV